MDHLAGDSALAAGVIAYLGPFSAAFRAAVLSQWIELADSLELPCSPDFALSTTVGSEVKLRGWEANGLPADPFSRDSAIMLYYSKQWPLVIDPQGQARKWIVAQETAGATPGRTSLAPSGPSQDAADSHSSPRRARRGGGGRSGAVGLSGGVPVGTGLRITRQTADGFTRVVEQCVQHGLPLLIDDIGDMIDPYLDPLLQQSQVKAGSHWSIRLGDASLAYNTDFKLFITTKSPNPHFPPEICVKVRI